MRRYTVYFSVNWLNNSNEKVNGKFKSGKVERIHVLLAVNIEYSELLK